MNLTRKLYKHKDNVAAQLNAGISAGTLSIVLKSGQGAQFPTTYSGTATSTGTANTLNATGIGASGAAVGDIIENVTDGSYGVITALSTNSATTTNLKGGSANMWANTNKWAVNRFVATLINYDTDGTTVLKREKVLIDSRSTDTLTVNTSGRGFDGSTAQSFSADDYIYILWTSAASDGLIQAFSQALQDIDRISQAVVFYGVDAGANDTYAITIATFPITYAAGQTVVFKANTVNTGACTLNVNSLGAKTIKKGATSDLEDGDIQAGETVTVVYDGTNFILINTESGATPPGTVAMFGASSAPAGWLLCDGSAVSRSTYAALFAIISTTYGSGNGTTTFNLPDIKGRVPVGFDSGQTEFDALGETGGAKTHTLSLGEIPAHTHVVSNTQDNAPSGGSGQKWTGSTGSIQSGSAGGGGAHNNLQPYITLQFIIKT